MAKHSMDKDEWYPVMTLAEPCEWMSVEIPDELVERYKHHTRELEKVNGELLAIYKAAGFR